MKIFTNCLERTYIKIDEDCSNSTIRIQSKTEEKEKEGKGIGKKIKCVYVSGEI